MKAKIIPYLRDFRSLTTYPSFEAIVSSVSICLREEGVPREPYNIEGADELEARATMTKRDLFSFKKELNWAMEGLMSTIIKR